MIVGFHPSHMHKKQIIQGKNYLPQDYPFLRNLLPRGSLKIYILVRMFKGVISL
jgi:hypothetical protein